MKKRKKQIIGFTIFFLFSAYGTQSQDTRLNTIKKAIAKRNESLTENLKISGIKAVMEGYTHDVLFFPQYKTAISSKTDLEDFYTEWTDSFEIMDYGKNTVCLEIIGNRLVEIGTFSLTGNEKQKIPFTGNYMVIWKKVEAVYQIEIELFGNDTYVTRNQVPYASVSIPIPHALPKYMLSEDTKIEKELIFHNNQVIEAVTKGDPEKRIRGFHDEAILIPNFSEIKKGKERIVPYIESVYHPESNLYVSHKFYDVRVIDENHVIVAGHYKGGWDRPNDKGSFEGNMLNLLKRNEEGKLVMYRQISNRIK
ncbi:MAG: hypothetical protein AAGH81_09965 [Bacteroidota bacterium]